MLPFESVIGVVQHDLEIGPLQAPPTSGYPNASPRPAKMSSHARSDLLCADDPADRLNPVP
jgi:hypothetical protein